MDAVITTDRLELRRFVAADVDALVPLFADAETMRHITGRTHTRDEVAGAVALMIDRFDRNGFGQMAAVLRETGEVIGRCGFAVWSIELRDEMEIGWLIGRGHWGRGYATEAGLALRDYGFHVLGRRRLISVIQQGNAASVRVAEKVGESPWKEIDHEGKRMLVYAVSSPGGAAVSLVGVTPGSYPAPQSSP